MFHLHVRCKHGFNNERRRPSLKILLYKGSSTFFSHFPKTLAKETQASSIFRVFFFFFLLYFLHHRSMEGTPNILSLSPQIALLQLYSFS